MSKTEQIERDKVGEKLKQGDVVKLNSGQGPAMVVTSASGDYVTVKWFDANLLPQVTIFPHACVRKLNDKK